MENTEPMPRSNVLYSIVVPVYNTSTSLKELAKRIDGVFKKTVRAGYELIYIDDASPNRQTWETLCSIVIQYRNTTALRLAKNCGQQAATLCGFREAGGDFLILMDDDLQHRPEDIPKLLVHRDHDLVIACFKKKKHTPTAKTFSRWRDNFNRIWMHQPGNIRFSSFWLVKKRIAQQIASYNMSKPLFAPLLFSLTQDVVNVEVDHDTRREGRSGYSIWKRINTFVRWFIDYSPVFWVGTVLFATVLCLVSVGAFLSAVFQKNIPVFIRSFEWGCLFSFLSGWMLLLFGLIGRMGFRIIRILEKRAEIPISDRASHEDTV